MESFQGPVKRVEIFTKALQTRVRAVLNSGIGPQVKGLLGFG